MIYSSKNSTKHALLIEDCLVGELESEEVKVRV